MFFTSVLPEDQERRTKETGLYTCEMGKSDPPLDQSPILPMRAERPHERLIVDIMIAGQALLAAATALGKSGQALEAPLYRCEKLAERIVEGRSMPHYLARVFDESATVAMERSERLASRHLASASAKLLPVVFAANVGRLMLAQGEIAPPALDSLLFPLTASTAVLTATTLVSAFYRPTEWKFRPAVAASLPAAISIGAELLKGLSTVHAIDPAAIVLAGVGGVIADRALRYFGGSLRKIDQLAGAARNFVSTVHKLQRIV